jgi:hypothetical protein
MIKLINNRKCHTINHQRVLNKIALATDASKFYGHKQSFPLSPQT